MIRNRVPGFMRAVRPAGQGFTPPVFRPDLVLPGGGGGTPSPLQIPAAPDTYTLSQTVKDPTAADLGLTCDQAVHMSQDDLIRAIAGYFNARGITEANTTLSISGVPGGVSTFAFLVARVFPILVFNCSAQLLLAQANALQTQAASSAGQVSTLSGQVSTLSGQVSTLTNASNQKDSTISGLQSASSQKDQQIQSLSSQLSSLPPSQVAAAATISDLQNQLTAAISKAGGITPLGFILGAAAGVAGDMLIRKGK